MEEPRVVTPPPDTSRNSRNAPSPPPNCAICLGNYVNKSFSNSCMHQFCFKCLMEWSKVNAVCPLCKQPFSSIIHNVKSNTEFEEYFVTPRRNTIQDDDIEVTEEFIVRAPYDFLLPNFRPTPRHFQFRTTFTVDQRGELAIQQLLSTHSNNSNYYVPGASHVNRRRVSTTNFRLWIYQRNLWALLQPEVGRPRNISPQYFAENVLARSRLCPWLNRELNALLGGNAQQVMFLISEILIKLCSYHIQSTQFRTFLEEHLHEQTQHFIHEFYSFMKSPYDMIGYDRNVKYDFNSSTVNITDEYDSDSDNTEGVTEYVPPIRVDPVVIEINSDSSDSDVIIEPEPIVVDSDSDTIENPAEPVEKTRPILPLKIRLKHKRKSRENRSRSRSHSSSTDSDSSSSFDSNQPSSRNRKLKSKYKRKYYIVKNDKSSEDEVINLLTSDNENERNEPIMPFKIRFKNGSDERSKRPISDSSDSDCSTSRNTKRSSKSSKQSRSKYYIVKKERSEHSGKSKHKSKSESKKRKSSKSKRLMKKSQCPETVTTATQFDLNDSLESGIDFAQPGPSSSSRDLETYTPPLPHVGTLKNEIKCEDVMHIPGPSTSSTTPPTDDRYKFPINFTDRVCYKSEL